MKKLPRVASLAIIGAILLGTVGSVSAWTNYNYATRVTDCGDLISEPLMASDGDVVTIKKWNTAVCWGQGIWTALADYGRNETPFVWGDTGTSTIGGKIGSVMSGIGLGYTANGGGTPFVGFFDADYGYAGAFDSPTSVDRPAKGMLAFMPKTKGFDNTLNFWGFEGGLKIAPGTDVSDLDQGSYLIGWEKVNLSDTLPFDNKCQYRVLAGGTMYYVSLVGNTYDNLNNTTNALQVTYAGGVVGIWQYDKTGLWHRNRVDTDTTNDPWIRNAGTGDWSIEKSCLPSYNPGNY